MLELFAKHGGFDLDAQGRRRSGRRSASHRGGRGHRAGATVRQSAGRPARASTARDISCSRWTRRWPWWRWIWAARPALVYKDRVKVRLVGDLQTELVEDFFGGFANHAGANVHVKVLYGRSNHHKIEAIFKCFARAMKYACSKDARLEESVAVDQRAVVISDFSITAPGICGRWRIRWARSGRGTN